MYQPGSISTPGTSVQGQLLQLTTPLGSAPRHTAALVLPDTLAQCGPPAVLPAQNGNLGLFVAGQVRCRNSPYSAPWPLLPFYLHLDPRTREWELTRLPDRANQHPYFVSGIPSAVQNGDQTLVYFNGAQLLEYTSSPANWWQWQVTPVPTPAMIVDADPVAILAAGSVFVFSCPAGESLLLCTRPLTSAAWHCAELSSDLSTPLTTFDGDPSAVFFAGKLHVFVIAAGPATPTPSLWDFILDPTTLHTEARRISTHPTAGTPSAVADATSIRLFARSADDHLLEHSSTDGLTWRITDISASTETIHGDPVAILLPDRTPIVCATSRGGQLLQLTSDPASSTWRSTQLSSSSNEVQRRPIPALSGPELSNSELYIFDLNIPI